MPVDWKAPDSFTRLLAATVASLEGTTKLNYKKIADFYGEGATYDAIEGRFRNIRKQAVSLRKEVEEGRAIAPQRGHRSADSTPRKPRSSGVLNGRVGKPSQTSPSKRRSEAYQLKRELLEGGSYSAGSTTSSSGTDAPTPSSNTATDNVIVLDDFPDDFTQFAASFDMNNERDDVNQDHLLDDVDIWGFDHVA